MAISLPDIVQRVVLDTKGFSSGSKSINRELTSTAGQLGKASDAADKAGDSHEKAGQKTDGHTSSLKKLHSGVRSAAPSLLRLSDNLYKVRTSHGAAALGADKNTAAQGRLGKALDKVRSMVFGAIKSLAMFGAKAGLVVGVILALTPVIGGVVGGLGALVGSMGRAIGLLPALASGFVGLIAVLATAKFLFGGLKDAMKEETAAASGSASTAKAVARAQESAAKAVESAKKRVTDAVKAAQKAAEEEAEAYVNVGVVHYEQSRKISDATRNVAEAEAEAESAKLDVARAQDDLNRSYETYAELMGELERDSKRASLSERDAVLDLEDARARLDKVNSDPEATVRDRARAALDLESAELDLLDAQRRARETEEELTTTRNAGADASDVVTDARNNLTEAQNRAADAEQGVADAEQAHFDASVDGWLSVIEAQKQAADATENTKERMADLAEAQAEVTEAARDGAEAIKEAAESGASAGGGDKKKVTGPMLALAAAIKEVKKGYAGLKEEGQAVAFPGAIDGIKILGRTFQAFKPQFLGTATVIGEFPRMLATGLASVQPEIGRVWNTNNNLMLESGGLLTSIIAAGAKVADASRGILDYFANSMKSLSGQIHTAAGAPDAFQRMQDFFNRALMSALTWWHIVRDFTIGTIKFFGVGADAGDKMAIGIADSMAKFRAWTDDDGNREKLATFFERSREMLGKVAWFIGQIATGFGKIASGPALPAMTGLLDKIFGGSQKDNGIAKFIESFGNKAILGGVDAVSGLFDVFTGKKEASTNVELMATSFSRLSELGTPLEIFAKAVSGMVDGILWLNENVPGFSTVMGGMLAVMSVGKMSGMSSLVKGLGNISLKIWGLLQNRELTKSTEQIRGVKRVLEERLSPSNVVEKELDDTKRAAKEATPVIGAVGEATGEAADKVEGSTGRFTKFRQGMGKFAAKADAASGAVAGVGGAVWAASALMGDSPMADTLNKIGAAMTIAGTVAQLASSFALLAPATGVADAALAANTAAVGANSVAWYANPVVIVIAAIIAAIALLGGALYLLYKKSDGFRKFVDGMWQSIQVGWDKILGVLKGALSWVGGKLVAGFKIGFRAIASAVSTAWTNWIKPAFSAFAEFFSTVLVPAFRAFLPAAAGAFDAVASAITWAWENVIKPVLAAFGWFFDSVLFPAFRFLRAVVEDVFGVVGTIIGGIWSTIVKPAFEGVGLIINNVVIPAFHIIGAVVEDVMGVMGTIISGVWSTIVKPAFDGLMVVIRFVVGPAFRFLQRVVSDVLGVMGKIISWTWNSVIKPVFDAVMWVINNGVVPAFNFVKDKAGAAWDWISGKVSAAWDAIKPIFEKIIEWVESKVQLAFETLGTAVGKVWDAIAGAVSTAFEKARSALNTAVRGLGNLLSPLLKGAAKIADAIGASNLSGALTSAADSTASWGESGASAQSNVSTSTPPTFATGGVFNNARPAEVGAGFKTGVPRAIVGEGSRHPEYVIPTDPKYRTNATRLLMEAARDIETPRFASGGMMDYRKIPGAGVVKDIASGVGNVVDALTHPMETLTDIAGAARKYGANFMDNVWPHVPADMRKDDLTGLPGHAMEKVRNDVVEWVRGKAIERDESMRAMAGQATGINPEFLDRFNRYSAERGPFLIRSGHRTMAEQAALYAEHISGQRPWPVAKPSPTAPHIMGMAIDHRPASTSADRAMSPGAFKLHYPVFPPEDWHVEPTDKWELWRRSNEMDVEKILKTIRTKESGGNYSIKNFAWPKQTASGAYQFTKDTWGGYGGYLHAYEAPPDVQDAKARSHLSGITSRYPNILEAVPAAWYTGHYNPDSFNRVPGTVNRLTVGDYVREWLQLYRTMADGGVIGDGIPQLAQGGIVTQDTLARIGEAGRHEAVIPLDSPRGRKMLGEDGAPSILLDMRHMTIEDGSDEEKVKKAVKKGVEEAMDAVAELVESGTR